MIELENVSKIYTLGKSEFAALKDINLKIDQSEFISITGHSGSGKSTLMNVMGCLDVPSKGDYFFEGKNVSKLSDDTLADIRNRKIGFVFQSFNLLPRYTALRNVELPLIYAGKPSQKRKELAQETLNLVGLSTKLNHKPNELSGGECQRVSIARALINDPKIVLADEPTGNLDSKTSEEIVAILKKLNKEFKKTIIIVTHNPEIAKLTQRTIILKDGIIIKDAIN